MKVLLINGSPCKKDNTFWLLKKIHTVGNTDYLKR